MHTQPAATYRGLTEDYLSHTRANCRAVSRPGLAPIPRVQQQEGWQQLAGVQRQRWGLKRELTCEARAGQSTSRWYAAVSVVRSTN
jgi:hypothetical protein